MKLQDIKKRSAEKSVLRQFGAKEETSVYVLGIDPGFANIGIVIAKLTKDRVKIVHGQSFVTKKADKKSRVLTTDDNMTRTKQIVRCLKELYAKYQFVAIAAEAMSFPRNASAAGKMCLCWGALGCLSEWLNLPIFQARPQNIRAALGMQPVKHETKEHGKLRVQKRVIKRLPEMVKRVAKAKIPATRQEHVFDAAAAVLTALNSPELQWVRGLL